MASKERLQVLAGFVERAEGFILDREDFVKNLLDGKCPFCRMVPDESKLKDEISRKEFALSHLCQSCQDTAFTGRIINGIREPKFRVDQREGVVGVEGNLTASVCCRLKT